MQRYEVFRDGRRVMSFTAEPGVLVSTAEPRPAKPAKHPFVNAQALDAAHEDALGTLFRKASDVSDLLDRLTAAGFEVRKP
jgi:hypothetical protein